MPPSDHPIPLSSSSHLQRRRLHPIEPSRDRRLHVREHRSPLLGTWRDHRPDPLAPAVPRFTPRPLRDRTVDHHEPDRLFRMLVRRLHPRRCEEPELTRVLLLESVRQVPTGPRRRHIGRAAPPHLGTRPFPLARELRCRQPFPTMDHRDQRPQRFASPLALHPVPRVGQRRQGLHGADQMRQAELDRDAACAHATTLRGEGSAADHPLELRAQHRDQHVRALRVGSILKRVSSVARKHQVPCRSPSCLGPVSATFNLSEASARGIHATSVAVEERSSTSVVLTLRSNPSKMHA